MAINPKSQVVRRGKKRWKKAGHTAKMLPYEVGKRWPGETTGGRRTGPVVSDHHPEAGVAHHANFHQIQKRWSVL